MTRQNDPRTATAVRPGPHAGPLAPLAFLLALIGAPEGVAGLAVAVPVPAARATQEAPAPTAGNAVSPEEAAARREFATHDINQDGVLTGTELVSCRCLRYDISGGEDGGDGIVQEIEFVTFNYLERQGYGLPWTEAVEVGEASGVGTPTPATADSRSAARPEADPEPVGSPDSADQVVAEPPLTRAEVLAMIRSMPGSQDLSHPYEARKEAAERQIRAIEERGVDFVLDMGTFDREFYEAGTGSFVRLAISRNYRAPGSAPRVIHGASALVGRYAMGIAGSTTRWDRSGSAVVRTDRDVGFAGGSLVIEAGGRYEWRLLSTADPAYTFRGAWRPATEAEVGGYVGAAIVLSRSYEGADWIVTEHESDAPGEHIRVMRLDQRFRSYLGTRRAP
jgi:hypothetical protein